MKKNKKNTHQTTQSSTHLKQLPLLSWKRHLNWIPVCGSILLENRTATIISLKEEEEIG